MTYETGGYPPGAENDERSPWNILDEDPVYHCTIVDCTNEVDEEQGICASCQRHMEECAPSEGLH